MADIPHTVKFNCWFADELIFAEHHSTLFDDAPTVIGVAGESKAKSSWSLGEHAGTSCFGLIVHQLASRPLAGAVAQLCPVALIGWKFCRFLWLKPLLCLVCRVGIIGDPCQRGKHALDRGPFWRLEILCPGPSWSQSLHSLLGNWATECLVWLMASFSSVS